MNRKLFSIALLFVLALPLLAASQPKSVVLTASATSGVAGSAGAACLLDPVCQGSWSPGSLDYGVDEGIFFQFEEVVSAQAVEIALAAPVDPTTLKVYINGKTKDSQGRFYILTQDAQNVPLLKVARAERAYGASAVPLAEPIKSLFLKIDLSPAGAADKIRIQKIRLLQNAQPVAFVLPALQPAQVSASSILDPQTAYHPAHLFDAKADFAWSTDGKKNDGRGESAHLVFGTPQDITGLIVWNGYQRSATHYQSNSRVSKLEIKSANGATQLITIKDASGPQRISLATPLSGVSDLTMTIKEIFPGTKYKDTLISEMRFVTTQGQIVLPQVALPRPAAPAAWAALIDRSYTSFFFQPTACTDCAQPDFSSSFLHQRIRLRSDGSFVIYKYEDNQKIDAKEVPLNQMADVLEGNWEPVPAGIRIFGKKYPTVMAASEYLKENVPANEAAIFQSELRLRHYAELSPGERQGLFDQLWAAKRGPSSKSQGARWGHCTLSPKYKADANVFGANQAAVFQSWDQYLQGVNPTIVQSTMLNDVLLPTEDVVDCSIAP